MYDVIYCDPPWKYNSRGARGGKFGALDYPTLSIKQLKGINVKDVTAKDCTLFMWATSPLLPDALKIGEAWGFKFKRVDKVWKKTKPSGARHGVVSPWGLTDAEFILLFVKGSPCKSQGERNQYTVYDFPYTGKHSEKPHFFREQIEKRFPNATRLEMFARTNSHKWDVFGNECDNSINLKV